MEPLVILVLFLVHQSTAVIYRLNDTDYARMPPLFRLDDYDSCLQQAGGMYCSTTFTLVASNSSDSNSELLTMIQEYSQHSVKHYNYSVLQYGICVTHTCRRHLTERTATDPRPTLEACLNETFSRDYRLQTAVTGDLVCYKPGDKPHITTGDIAVAAACLVIVLLNVIGSLYDTYHTSENSNKLLLCFSMQRNWPKLVSLKTNERDPRMAGFRMLNGFRVISMLLVMAGHVSLPFVVGVENTNFFEEALDNPLYQVLYCGPITIQSYLVVSSVLLVYKVEMFKEHHTVTWRVIPVGLTLRWARLSAVVAVWLALISTWAKFLGPGPWWEANAAVEIADCRKYWWRNLLYINNYYPSNCMMQTWYTATDMQLFCLGLVVCVVVKSTRTRNIVVAALLAVGVVTPAVITYAMDLDHFIIPTFESIRSGMDLNPTTTYVYYPFHTNLSCHAIGLALGYYLLYLQRANFDIKKYKAYRYIFWSTFPALVFLIWLSATFIGDGLRASVIHRAAYASLAKLAWGSVFAIFVIGLVFRCENLYRGVMEWRYWSPLARLSYCTFIMHLSVIRWYGGMRKQMVTVSFIIMIKVYVQVIVVCVALSTLLWLLVEEPFDKVTKMILVGGDRGRNKVADKRN